MISLKTKMRERLLNLQVEDTWYKEVIKIFKEEEMVVPKYEGYSLDGDGLLHSMGEYACHRMRIYAN